MIRFAVHVHPGSRTSSVGGSYDGALNVHVRARAVDGAATDEVLSALAQAFGARTNAVQCVHGGRSRTKFITIEGDDAALALQLRDLLAQ
jgi:uncharacterized protein YggU (UPF0235/DUF167 family)